MKKDRKLTLSAITAFINETQWSHVSSNPVKYSECQSIVNRLEAESGTALGHMSTQGRRQKFYTEKEVGMILDVLKDRDKVASHVSAKKLEKEARREFNRVVTPHGTVLKYFIFKYMKNVPDSVVIRKLRDLGGFSEILEHKAGTLKTTNNRYYAPWIGVVDEERLMQLVDYMAADKEFNKKYKIKPAAYDQMISAFVSESTKIKHEQSSKDEAVRLASQLLRLVV